MANPKPGDKDYSGPVGEGWGRPIKNFAKDVDQHIRNAAGIPGDIDKNIRSFLDWGKGDREKAARVKALRQRNARAVSAGLKARNQAAGTRQAAQKTKVETAAKKKRAASLGKMKVAGPVKGFEKLYAKQAKAKAAPKTKPVRATAPARGPNKRTKAVGKAAAKVMARNAGLSKSEARAKARSIVKKRSK